VSSAAIWRSQVERSVWTLLVEVADVDAEDVLPMPAQQRLRLNHEGLPAASRQDPAQRREQQPVVRHESRLTDLPAEDRQLVPEHENLELVGCTYSIFLQINQFGTRG
jgi:hypothetical protein